LKGGSAYYSPPWRLILSHDLQCDDTKGWSSKLKNFKADRNYSNYLPQFAAISPTNPPEFHHILSQIFRITYYPSYRYRTYLQMISMIHWFF